MSLSNQEEINPKQLVYKSIVKFLIPSYQFTIKTPKEQITEENLKKLEATYVEMPMKKEEDDTISDDGKSIMAFKEAEETELPSLQEQNETPNETPNQTPTTGRKKLEKKASMRFVKNKVHKPTIKELTSALAILLLVPIIYDLIPLFIPLANWKDGFWNNLLFTLVVVPLNLTPVGYLPSFWISALFSQPPTFSPLPSLTIVSIWLVIAFCFGGADIFPVPFSPMTVGVGGFLGACVVSFFIIIPKDMRVDPLMRPKFLWAAILLSLPAAVYYVFMAYGILFDTDSLGVQIVVAIFFEPLRYSIRQLFIFLTLRINENISRLTGSYVEFLSNLYFVILFSNIRSPIVFVLMIVMDVGNNLFHILLFSGRIQWADKYMTFFFRVRDDETREFALLSGVLFSELAEILAPIHYIIVYSVLYFGPNKMAIYTIDTMEESQYYQGLLYAGIDIGVELIIFAGVHVLLKKICKMDLSTLFAFYIRKQSYFYTMLVNVTVCTLLSYVIIMKHYGCDFKFDFDWL